MWRIFLSHSRKDNRYALALKEWLVQQNPPLANEIFLDFDRHGIRTGTRWKDALKQASNTCEAVICLLSNNWEESRECEVEYRTAEALNKRIFAARIDPHLGTGPTREWQQISLVGDGQTTKIEVGDGGPPVAMLTAGLRRLRDDIIGAGISPDSFVWPPPDDDDRVPYRAWDPLEEVDAAIFFGRDAQIVRGLDALRGMRRSGIETMFVVLGPSGTGKSSFLRAGLLPRLRRDDRNFLLLDIVRPQRDVLEGDSGLAQAVHKSRKRLRLHTPGLAEIKRCCVAGDVVRLGKLLAEMQHTAHRSIPDEANQASPPTLVMPVDQIEELFSTDAGPHAARFLELIAGLAETASTDAGLIVAATIRTDRYHALQTAEQLARVDSVLFDHLKPMPRTEFKEVITGPAARGVSGRELRIEPALCERLLEDAQGADALPLLALTLRTLLDDYADIDAEIPASGFHLSVEDYENLGGIDRVVQTMIDSVLARDLAKRREQLLVLRKAFIPWLVSINPDNDQPMRRIALWDDLPPESHSLLDHFVTGRLLVKDRLSARSDIEGGDSDRKATVEVALESLLRQWDDLAGWFDEERENLKTAYDVERAAAAWDARNRDEAWLLAGSRLAAADLVAQLPGYAQRLSHAGAFLAASHRRVSTGPSETQLSYDAFLCYAYPDRVVASAIQEGLHQIGRRVGQLRALRVFGDDPNLTANPDLWGTITEALDSSRFMIAVLSPQYASSRWVNEEVSYWLQHRGHEQLMLVLAKGQLVWDATTQRFDPEQSDAAPPVLTQPGSLPAEPLYIDVTDDAPWDYRAPLLREKITALAAPIHGKPKDGLASDELREQRRFRRNRLAAVAAVAILIVVAVTFAVLAFVK